MVNLNKSVGLLFVFVPLLENASEKWVFTHHAYRLRLKVNSIT